MHHLSLSQRAELEHVPQVLCYSTESNKLLKTLNGHTGAVSAAVFSAAGDFMVSVGSDSTLRMWGKHAA